MSHTAWRRSAVGLVTLMALTLLLGACGSTGGQGNANPTSANTSPTEVQISLSEFKIESSLTTFTVGTPYRFVIKNDGKEEHDWAITPRGAANESGALAEVEEDELPPGATVTRDLTFTQPGDLEFSCHVAGHYEAGMMLPITVQ